MKTHMERNILKREREKSKMRNLEKRIEIITTSLDQSNAYKEFVTSSKILMFLFKRWIKRQQKL